MPDANPDAETEQDTILNSTSSDVLNSGSSLEALPPPLDPLNDPTKSPSPPRESKGTKPLEGQDRGEANNETQRLPEHYNISDDDVEEERPTCIPNYDITAENIKAR